MWSFSFKFFMNSSCAFFFPPDIRAYSRRYCLFRCWIYRKFPIYWGISSTSWTWGTSYLQFGKHVRTWCGKCWVHFRLLLELSFCTFSKLPSLIIISLSDLLMKFFEDIIIFLFLKMIISHAMTWNEYLLVIWVWIFTLRILSYCQSL